MHMFATLCPPCGSLLVLVQWKRCRFHHRPQYAHMYEVREQHYSQLASHSVLYVLVSFRCPSVQCEVFQDDFGCTDHKSNDSCSLCSCVLFSNIQNSPSRSLFFNSFSSWSVDTAPMCDHFYYRTNKLLLSDVLSLEFLQALQLLQNCFLLVLTFLLLQMQLA